MASAQAPRVDNDPGDEGGGKIRPVSYLIDHPWMIVGLAAFVLLAWWAYGTRTQKYELKATFSEAVSLYSGLDVRVEGIDAGKVKKVENIDGQAVVTLGIEDDEVWPLTQGTQAVLRFGSTIGNGTRIIDIVPGPKDAPELPDGGQILNRDTVEATEFDQIFDTFDGKTRESLASMLENTADTFAPRKQELGEAVEETGPGLDAIGAFADDLSRDEASLRAFVTNTHRVTRTLAARRQDLSGLIQVASSTFNEFAQNTDGIRGSLDRFAPALRETRTTLARLDTTVDVLDGLMTDIRPGARQLDDLANDLRPAMASLRETVPNANRTLRTVRTAAPPITELLEKAQPFSPAAGKALGGLAPMIGCLRPYAPEFAGLMATWTSFTSNYDSGGHIGRLTANTGPTALTSFPNISSGDVTRLVPGQGYSLVKPPGYTAGKPWFIPECGITPDGLDPDKDPSDR